MIIYLKFPSHFNMILFVRIRIVGTGWKAFGPGVGRCNPGVPTILILSNEIILKCDEGFAFENFTMQNIRSNSPANAD